MSKHFLERRRRFVLTVRRRRRALRALRLAEEILETELREPAPDGQERASIAGALESVRAAALHLQPAEGPS